MVIERVGEHVINKINDWKIYPIFTQSIIERSRLIVWDEFSIAIAIGSENLLLWTCAFIGCLHNLHSNYCIW